MNNLEMSRNQTPIEIALGIDENGMTTARKLYDFLELRKADFARWCKTNITENEFAAENEDYVRFFFNAETPTGGKIQREDYKLTAHFAKKLSCEVNELADHIKRRIVYLLGGKDSVASKNQVVLKKSLVAIYNQIRVEFGLFDEYGKIKDILKMERKYLADVHEYIDMYELPGFLKDEVEKEKKMAKDKQLQGFMNKQKKLISESDGAERAELIGLAVGFLNGMRISKAITKEEYEKEYEELQKEIRKVG